MVTTQKVSGYFHVGQRKASNLNIKKLFSHYFNYDDHHKFTNMKIAFFALSNYLNLFVQSCQKDSINCQSCTQSGIFKRYLRNTFLR